MSLRTDLILVANALCARRSLSTARLSTILFNDGKALARIGAGGDLNTGTYERAMEWMSLNWPEGASWPAAVPRPSCSPPVVDTQARDAAEVSPASAAFSVSQEAA
jgi:hypothetical protein